MATTPQFKARRVSFTNILMYTPNGLYTPSFTSAPTAFNTTPIKFDFLTTPNKVVDSTSTFLDFIQSLGTPIHFMNQITPPKSVTAPPIETTLPTLPTSPSLKRALCFDTTQEEIDTSEAPTVGIKPAPSMGYCHACRNQNDSPVLVYPCFNLAPPTNSYNSMSQCKLKYCLKHIEQMVGESRSVYGLPHIQSIGGWCKYIESVNTAQFCCPRCTGFCNCNKCRKYYDPTAPVTNKRHSKRSKSTPKPYWVIPKNEFPNYAENALLALAGESAPSSPTRVITKRTQCLKLTPIRTQKPLLTPGAPMKLSKPIFTFE